MGWKGKPVETKALANSREWDELLVPRAEEEVGSSDVFSVGSHS